MAGTSKQLNRDSECENCGGHLVAGMSLDQLEWNAQNRRWHHRACPAPAPGPAPSPTSASGAQRTLPSDPPASRPMAAAPSGTTDLARLTDADLAQRYGCTRAQYDVMRQHIAPKLTLDQLDYCLAVSKMRGLSPWMKQVYFSVYKSRTPGKPDNLVMLTGIDGYVRIAHGSGVCDGIEEPEYGPEVESDGVKHPEWARVRVYRKGSTHPFVATARWTEYRKVDQRGIADDFWFRMPYGQLGKCALSRAIRLAFPEHTAGIYTSEEMAQASNEDREQRAVIDVPAEDVRQLPAPTPSPPAGGQAEPDPAESPGARGEPSPPETGQGTPPAPQSADGPRASDLEAEVPDHPSGDPALGELVREIEGMLNPAGRPELGKNRARMLHHLLTVEGIPSLREATDKDVGRLDRVRTVLMDVSA
jgi:phage recombination protein Bet